MALSPSSSAVPPSILAPSVLALPRGASEVGGAGGDAAVWDLEGAVRVARNENQQLRAAIARVKPRPTPPTLTP